MKVYRRLMGLTLITLISVFLSSCFLLGQRAPKLELSKNYFIFTHASADEVFLQEEFGISPQPDQTVYVALLGRKYAANESTGLAEHLGCVMAWAQSGDNWYVLGNHNMFYKISIQTETHIASDHLDEFDEIDQSLFLCLQSHPEVFFSPQILDDGQSIEWNGKGYVKFEDLNEGE